MNTSVESESGRYASRRPAWQPARVIVDSGVADDDTTQSILDKVATRKVFAVADAMRKNDRQILIDALNLPSTRPDAELARLGRTSLLLTDSEELVQQMAAGPAMERRCFNFLKILPYTGVCPYDCAYCWFKDPVLIPRVNVRFFDRLPDVLDRLRADGRTPTVFTFTHYKTDCFTMEHLTGFCRRAADWFEREDGFAIQFLTKSDQVDCLLEAPVPRKAIVTFSVNPEWITRHVDVATPPLSARLAAARRLHESGVPVMLRVDPILAFNEWRAAYDDLAESVFEHFEPAHVTLGTPRFQDVGELGTIVERIVSPQAREFMRAQASQMGVSKPGTPVADDSFRSYFKNMSVSYPDTARVDLYRTVADAFLRRRPQLPLGLCEEPAAVWADVGLPWTGDKTKDCSCNFVPLAMTKLFSPEERERVAQQAEEAHRQDALIAGEARRLRLRVVAN
jgi:DNA repair photolyase